MEQMRARSDRCGQLAFKWQKNDPVADVSVLLHCGGMRGKRSDRYDYGFHVLAIILTYLFLIFARYLMATTNAQK